MNGAIPGAQKVVKKYNFKVKMLEHDTGVHVRSSRCGRPPRKLKRSELFKNQQLKVSLHARKV